MYTNVLHLSKFISKESGGNMELIRCMKQWSLERRWIKNVANIVFTHKTFKNNLMLEEIKLAMVLL